MATKEVNEVEFSYVFCGCLYENVVLSDQFNECLSFAFSTFYSPCVMLCWTRAGLDLDLSCPAVVLVLTLSQSLNHTKMYCLIPALSSRLRPRTLFKMSIVTNHAGRLGMEINY